MKEGINIREKLTKLFCDSESYRGLDKPFINGGFIYFASTDCCLMIKEGSIEGEFKESRKHINLGYLTPITTITSQQIERFIDTCSKVDEYVEEEIACPECNGKRTVIAEYNSYYNDECGDRHFEFDVDCPIFDGEGTIIKGGNTGNKIPDLYAKFLFPGKEYSYSVRNISKLLDAMQTLEVKSANILRMDSYFIAKLTEDAMFLFIGYPKRSDEEIQEFNLNN